MVLWKNEFGIYRPDTFLFIDTYIRCTFKTVHENAVAMCVLLHTTCTQQAQTVHKLLREWRTFQINNWRFCPVHASHYITWLRKHLDRKEFSLQSPKTKKFRISVIFTRSPDLIFLCLDWFLRLHFTHNHVVEVCIATQRTQTNYRKR